MLGYGNRLEFFADLLAVWRIGACAIPVDARFSAYEVETLARAARARAWVSCGAPDAALAARLIAAGTAPLDTLDLGATPAGPDVGPPMFGLDDDALILFTSGTTGNPKGVVHTHRTLRARWLALRDHLGVEAYARTLCLLPTHFGHGLICNALFPWLSRAVTLHPPAIHTRCSAAPGGDHRRAPHYFPVVGPCHLACGSQGFGAARRRHPDARLRRVRAPFGPYLA